MKKIFVVSIILILILAGCKEKPTASDPAQENHEHNYVAETETETEKEENSAPMFTCGNTQTRIYSEAMDVDYTFMGGDSVWLSQLLADLEYSPDKLCKCLPAYTVDTEYKTGYGIDLGETPYARCDEGQAELTKEQAQRIEEIIKKLKEGKSDI